MRPGVIRAWIAAMLLVAAPGAAGAQVFLASRPNPEFMVGPLFVRLAVTPELGVTLDVLWSLVVPPNKSGAAIAQDLYLLWPNSVGASTEGAPDPALAAYVTARVVGHGRGKKIRVFFYGHKAGWKRTRGHRSELTKIEITGIA